ncbi:MAG TPA: enoyl-CoA hydratase [Acidimicrobiales bacterium]|nr:enoyl-CoA hydratase [Acidimicrobiales bacterium]
MSEPTTHLEFDTGTERLLAVADDGVAVVTFNNPAKRNALSSDIRAALPGLLAALDAEPAVRVVVMTGAGDLAFVSGADISEFGEGRTSADARAEYDRGFAAINRGWAELSKPVIAMIRGFCMGGGLLTALQADIRIASEDSQFGVPAARLGLGYSYGGVEALMAVVGPAFTSEILLSARRFDARQALAMGLVNRVVPPDRLEDEVMGLARDITENAPLTVAACKAAVREAGRPADRRDLRRVESMVEACFRSEDYLEGQRAFAEKRRPVFKGR